MSLAALVYLKQTGQLNISARFDVVTVDATREPPLSRSLKMPLNSPPPEKEAGETPGTLYVVATPIGNRDDITIRALKTLASVDLVAAEDTRHTSKLLAMHSITARLISLQEHNEARRTPRASGQAGQRQPHRSGSDAGTPSVSDPGFRLVTAAVAGRPPRGPHPRRQRRLSPP